MNRKKMVGMLFAMTLAATMLAGCGDSTKKQFESYAKCGTIGEYKGVEYTPASREVTEEQVQSSIESFCNNNSVTEENKVKAIADGDVVNIDFVETISGVQFDSETGYNTTMGYDVLGPGFDEQMIGYRPGSEVKVIVNYPDDYSDTTVAGLTAEFDVTINYISITTVPEYTDELVNEATAGEYTNTDDYTVYLREQLQEQADSSADETDRQSVLQSVIDVSTFTKYPEDEVSAYVQNVMGNIETQCGSYGITVETYIMYFYGYTSENEFLNFLKDTVTNVMEEKIVVCSIALKEDLMATDDEISAYRQKLADEYGIDVSEVSEYCSDEDLVFYATEDKVLQFVLDNAVQVEASEEDTSENATETE